MKDGSFVMRVKCGIIWFVLSSTEPQEVAGTVTHVGTRDMHANSLNFQVTLIVANLFGSYIYSVAMYT